MNRLPHPNRPKTKRPAPYAILDFALKLGALGFVSASDQRPHSEYIDYTRYPMGWGNTAVRDDRYEIISYNTDDGTFYGTVEHRDESGDDWYRSDLLGTEADRTLEALDAAFKVDRTTAPRHNDETPVEPSNITPDEPLLES